MAGSWNSRRDRTPPRALGLNPQPSCSEASALTCYTTVSTHILHSILCMQFLCKFPRCGINKGILSYSILVSLHGYSLLYSCSLTPANIIHTYVRTYVYVHVEWRWRLKGSPVQMALKKKAKSTTWDLGDCWHLRGPDRLWLPPSIPYIVWKTQDEKAQACSPYSTHSSATPLTSQEAFRGLLQNYGV